MTTKARSPGQTNTSLSLSVDEKAKYKARAKSLGLKLSQYFRVLGEMDLGEPQRAFTIKPQPVQPPPSSKPSVLNKILGGSDTAKGGEKPLPNPPVQSQTLPAQPRPSRKSKRG